MNSGRLRVMVSGLADRGKPKPRSTARRTCLVAPAGPKLACRIAGLEQSFGSAAGEGYPVGDAGPSLQERPAFLPAGAARRQPAHLKGRQSVEPHARTTPRLMRKRRQERLVVTSRSTALFRLGELCNNQCKMCSNSGRPDAWRIPTDELLRRVAFLRERGIRRVVVTGGEPTIHPGFWEVVAELGNQGIAWDINSHGRSFADPAFTDRAVDAGLERAIISLHSHEASVNCAISGIEPRHHEDTVRGIHNLVDAGLTVMINLVINTLNAGSLEAWARWCVRNFGRDTVLKVAFPTSLGRGGGWEGIHLRYDDVRDECRGLLRFGREVGVRVAFESIPNCILDTPDLPDLGRSGFGESHYLEDLQGRRLLAIRHIEAALAIWPESCRACSALPLCPGVSEEYARRYGVDELVPFGPLSEDPADCD